MCPTFLWVFLGGGVGGGKFFIFFFFGVWLFFFGDFFLYFLGCGGTLLLFVQHSFIHTIFFHVFGGSVSVGRVFFGFWGITSS